MHKITFSKAGYQTQVIEFPLTKKKRTDLNVICYQYNQVLNDFFVVFAQKKVKA